MGLFERIPGRAIKIGSQEYNDLMKKWSDEAWGDEMQRDYGEYLEHKKNYGG